jgi:hypothetical protein
MERSKFDPVQSLRLTGLAPFSVARTASSLRLRALRSRELSQMAYDPDVVEKLDLYAQELEAEAERLERETDAARREMA